MHDFDKGLPFVLNVENYDDSRGSICIVDDGFTPFNIKRVYYIFSVPTNVIRGEHGHKKLKQIFICMSGRCEIEIYNGRDTWVYVLDNPKEVLYIPSGMWRRFKFLEEDTVCCVLASERYNKDDYLYTIEDFDNFVKGS